MKALPTYLSTIILFAFSACLVTTLAAENLVYQDAQKYTVKVRSSVAFAAYPDDSGTRSGAGVLIDRKRGWIVTNRHVSGVTPKHLEVMFSDRDYLPAKVIFTDHFLDLSILKTDPLGISRGSFSASPECRALPDVGEQVVAFGFPFGLELSGSRGVVSSIQKDIDHVWIQTDAAINSGNSGGALTNLSTGRVVGINTSGYSKSKAEGIGFAIPMDHICRILDILRREEDPNVHLIPVSFAPKPDHDFGLTVAWVYQNLPLIWPLKVGDEIISVKRDGFVPVENEGELIHELRGQVGSAYLKILRNQSEREIEVPLALRKNLSSSPLMHVSGMTLANYRARDSELRPISSFIRIHEIDEGSDASVFGLEQWDYVVDVDGEHGSGDITDLCRHLYDAEKRGQRVRLTVQRYEYNYFSDFGFRVFEITPEDVGMIVSGENTKNC